MRLANLLTAGMLLFPSLASAEFRPFTNDNGNVIQAELVSHAKGKVTLKREDGKEFTVDPSVFSDSDQKYIETWIKKNPAEIKYNLGIDSKKKKLEGSTENHGYKRVKNDLWAYIISVRNNSQETVADLTVKYRVFYTNAADGEYRTYSSSSSSSSSPENSSRERMLEGTAKLEGELRFNQTMEITTTPVRIDLVDYAYSRSRYKDELKGCLVRVLDKQGNIVYDWVSPEVAMKGKYWHNTDPSPEKRGSSVIVR